MKRDSKKPLFQLLPLTSAWLLMCPAVAIPAFGSSIVWQYTLLPGSQLVDDCLFCGRPPIVVPMQGTFRLRLLQENPLFSSYDVEGVSSTAGTPGSSSYKVTGQGAYETGGEVVLAQHMFLEAQIDSSFTNRLCYFTNASGAVDRLWPMIHITLNQTNGLDAQTYTLVLNAAPLRDIWFSTTSGMTSSHWQSPTNHISSGDLLSLTGRVVRRNAELTHNLGIMPIVPDLGLDAVDVLSGGEIIVSMEQSVFSETLGSLQEGDLLSAEGRIVARNQDLTRAFLILPPVPDVGLDAVQVQKGGEMYFSTKFPIRTGTGTLLGKGDLLSDRGAIVRSNAQLLARFQPTDPTQDYGLDAFYVWPSGEIWFSTETGFQDQSLGPIRAGDLLSDQGFIVYRNLELVSAFAPLEDLADFGLDALHVLFGKLPSLDMYPSKTNVVISWETTEAVLQEATAVTGPWSDVSPALVPSPYVVSPTDAKFFRLREL